MPKKEKEKRVPVSLFSPHLSFPLKSQEEDSLAQNGEMYDRERERERERESVCVCVREREEKANSLLYVLASHCKWVKRGEIDGSEVKTGSHPPTHTNIKNKVMFSTHFPSLFLSLSFFRQQICKCKPLVSKGQVCSSGYC